MTFALFLRNHKSRWKCRPLELFSNEIRPGLVSLPHSLDSALSVTMNIDNCNQIGIPNSLITENIWCLLSRLPMSDPTFFFFVDSFLERCRIHTVINRWRLFQIIFSQRNKSFFFFFENLNNGLDIFSTQTHNGYTKKKVFSLTLRLRIFYLNFLWN